MPDRVRDSLRDIAIAAPFYSNSTRRFSAPSLNKITPDMFESARVCICQVTKTTSSHLKCLFKVTFGLTEGLFGLSNVMFGLSDINSAVKSFCLDCLR
jgi:hypothetical protein